MRSIRGVRPCRSNTHRTSHPLSKQPTFKGVGLLGRLSCLQIETALSSIMPGVSWKTWTPFFMEESDSLIDTWRGRVEKYLEGLPMEEDRVSSQALKKDIRADKVAPMTWTRVLRSVGNRHHAPKKDHMESGACSAWKLEGRSLVRHTAETYGFTA